MIKQFFWKLHCPRNASGAPVKLAVNEIGAAAEEQTDRRCDDEIVAQIQPRNLMSMRVIKREEQQPDHPAMTRHSAFPNSQDRNRGPQHFWIVKKNVTEPSTNDNAEKRCPSNKVSDFCDRQIGISAFRQPEKKEKAGDKCQDIGQPVPTRPDVIVDSENNRIEFVQIIREHSWADCA